MGVSLSWTMASLGVVVPTAYARLHRYGRRSSLDSNGRVGLSELLCEFLVYANQASREDCKPIGSVLFTIAGDDVDWSSDLAAQAYAELKIRFPESIDAI